MRCSVEKAFAWNPSGTFGRTVYLVQAKIMQRGAMQRPIGMESVVDVRPARRGRR